MGPELPHHHLLAAGQVHCWYKQDRPEPLGLFKPMLTMHSRAPVTTPVLIIIWYRSSSPCYSDPHRMKIKSWVEISLLSWATSKRDGFRIPRSETGFWFFVMADPWFDASFKIRGDRCFMLYHASGCQHVWIKSLFWPHAIRESMNIWTADRTMRMYAKVPDGPLSQNRIFLLHSMKSSVPARLHARQVFCSRHRIPMRE